MSTNISIADDPKAYWNQEAGPRWVTHQEAVDIVLEPISNKLFECAAPVAGEHALDIGCGCGSTTLALAKKVGTSGRVVGVDISEPMLARASERCASLSQVELHAADATDYEFSRGAANLAISRFGSMFFLNPLAAFRNIRSGLRPGGRLCFAVWQAKEKNPWILGPMKALPEAPAPEPLPEGAPGPFSLADEEHCHNLLKQAGFCSIAMQAFETALPVGETPDAALLFYSRVGPLSGYLQNLGPAERAGAEKRVLRYLREIWNTDAMPVRSSTWILTATSS